MIRIAIIVASLLFLSTPLLLAEEVKIGLITPLAGSSVVYGEDAKNLFPELIKSHKGARSYQLVVEDGACGIGAAASTAIRKLINIDKVKFVLATCSGEILQVAPIAEQSKVVLIGFAASHPDIQKLGRYVFRTYPDIRLAVRLITQEMKERGVKRLGIINEEVAFTSGIKRELEAAMKEELVGSVDFLPDEIDFRSIVQRVKAEQPDAIYLNVATPRTYQAVFTQLRQSGVSQQIFAYHNPGEPDSITNLGQSQNGVIYVDMEELDRPTPEFEALYRRFTAKYRPISPFLVATSYNAIQSIIQAVEKVGPDVEAVVSYLEQEPISGAEGSFRYDQNGDAQGVGFTMKTIRAGQPQPLAQ